MYINEISIKTCLIITLGIQKLVFTFLQKAKVFSAVNCFSETAGCQGTDKRCDESKDKLSVIDHVLLHIYYIHA